LMPLDDIDTGDFNKLMVTYNGIFDEDHRHESVFGKSFKPAASSSSSSSARTLKKHGCEDHHVDLKARCVACSQEHFFFDIMNVPCGHDYCRNCMDTVFTTAMQDEQFFPPRCCKREITLKEAQMYLTAGTIKDFPAKEDEYNTKDRTYCVECSRFISKEYIQNDNARCPDCDTETCTMCKQLQHTGQDCPQDMALQDLLEMADEQGWQRCYDCKRIVELDHGCFHMT
jgi:hypothetical protein